VTLARAVYSTAQIILLDDVLAALDVHTARWIVDRCLKGDLLKDRTILLVSNNLALTSSLASKVIRIDSDGTVIEESSLDAAVQHDAALRVELTKESKQAEEIDQVSEDDADKPTETQDKPSGQLTVAEEVAHGSVSLDAIMLYFGNLGGIAFWTSFTLLVLIASASRIAEPYVLGRWSNEYQTHPSSEVPATL
jgi:ABC-type methionine transport system ATPase subunit